MNKLTDLEICKRIAEIKKIMPTVFNGTLITNIGEFNLFDLSRTHRANKHARYVFELMLEFGVCISQESGDVWICGGDGYDGCLGVASFDCGDELSLRRAILLVIIKAHKEL